MRLLAKSIDDNPLLEEIPLPDYLTDISIEWWLDNNPDAQGKASGVKVNILDPQSSLVQGFASAKGIVQSSRYRAVIMDIRGYSVIVAYQKDDGNYVLAFTDATPDPALRAELESKTAAELYAILRKKTGVTLANGEENNHQRLVRSVEKAMADGWEAPQAKPRYRCLLLGVNFPREKVCQRIDDRLQTRIDAGMIEEVAGLREAGATDEFLEGLGLEYRYILRYLKGEIPSLEALKDELGRAIKRFAKRQVQWFSRDRDVLWLDMEGDFLTQAVRAVEQFLREP